jgi:alpha-tubulin suppressor-like RCC1 family protein
VRTTLFAVALACVLAAPLACSLVVSTTGLSGGDAPGTEGGTDSGGDALVSDGAGTDAPVGVDGGRDGLVATGGTHSCAVFDNRATCWGNNSSGQLGNGSKAQALAPVAVEGLPPGAVTAIGAGDKHTCVVVAGDVYCWGTNDSGAIGPGANADSAVPVRVTGLPGPAVDVRGGFDFTCALVGKRVYCWGDNGNSRLGDGTAVSHKAPSAVVDANGILEDIVEISTGNDHACARKSTGVVVCWGHSDNGTLGNVDAGAASAKAVPVEGLPGPAQSVSIAGWHGCAIVAGGVWCWGTGGLGELGNGGTSDSVAPVPVNGLGDEVTLAVTAGGAADQDATCAVRKGGLWCWGAGKYFRLGDGMTSARKLPYAVTTLPSVVTKLAGGDNHWCALLANGEVRCWGAGVLGQLGDGAGVDRAIPVVVNGL